MRLSLQLGKTLKELVSTISYKELMLWLCYYEIEPWGATLDGLRIASATSAIYNAGLMVSNPRKLKAKHFSPDQFYIGVGKEQKKVVKRPWREQRKIYDKILGEAKK